jgi:hypothetical protein
MAGYGRQLVITQLPETGWGPKQMHMGFPRRADYSCLPALDVLHLRRARPPVKRFPGQRVWRSGLLRLL